MATTYKILGQVLPADTSVTDLYTVPASTSTVVSTITATNVDGVPSNIFIYAVASGDTAGTSNALVYDALLGANTVQAFTLGVTLAAGDKLQVALETGSAVNFQAFGSELS
jgi:hypothetical protein